MSFRVKEFDARHTAFPVDPRRARMVGYRRPPWFMTFPIHSLPIVLFALTWVAVVPRPSHAEFAVAAVPVDRGSVVSFPDGIGDVLSSVEEHALPGAGSLASAPVPPVRAASSPLFDIGVREESRVDLASVLRARPVPATPEYPVELNDRIRHFL